MTRYPLMIHAFVVLLFAAPFGGTVHAEEKKEKDFADRKAEILKELDERATKLQEHKTCVAAAADREALKACREKMKEWRQEERKEHMDSRKERLEKRRERRDERKKGN